MPKTAISIRINPEFLGKDKSYPEAPYGVFLMVGNDFHGFHVRFNDVARGGLRFFFFFGFREIFFYYED